MRACWGLGYNTRELWPAATWRPARAIGAAHAPCGRSLARKQVPFTMWSNFLLRGKRRQNQQQPPRAAAPATTDALRNTDGAPSNRSALGPDRRGGGPNGAPSRNNNNLSWLSRLLFLMLVLFVVYYVGTNLLSGSFAQQTVDVSLSDFNTQLDTGHVVSATIQDHDITGKLDHHLSSNGSPSDQFHAVSPVNDDAALHTDLQKNNVKIVGKQSGAGDIWITLLFNLGPILLLVLLLIWLSRRATPSQP